MANKEHLEILKQGVVAWNKWRDDNPDMVPDLSGADLHGRKLMGVNFSETNLSEANLREAELIGANFSGAILRQASLFQADMFFAYFDAANLIGANFRDSVLSQSGLFGANLSAANLSGADLSAADLKEAFFFETILGNTNLTDTKNLASIIHRGPSTIDHRTLDISGDLAKEFLRGCGLSDWQIEATKLSNPHLAITEAANIAHDTIDLWCAHPVQHHSYFISFSHDDATFARRLHHELQEGSIRVWLDEKGSLPKDEPYEQLDRRLRLGDKILLCCSKSSLTSGWVDDEVNFAVEKEQELVKKRRQNVLSIILLDLDGFVHSEEWKSTKNEITTSAPLIDFTNSNKDVNRFDEKVREVIRTLRTGWGAGGTPTRPNK